jgi:HNH endonuclease
MSDNSRAGATALTTPCRVYRGVLDADGYGRVNKGKKRWDRNGRYKGRTPILLSRWIVAQVDGPLAPGEVVRHLCDNPPCFRYDHLKRGTQPENLADMREKGRAARNAQQGTANANALLTEAAVRQILLIPATVPSRVVGAQYGVSSSLIRAVRSRNCWSHVQV